MNGTLPPSLRRYRGELEVAIRRELAAAPVRRRRRIAIRAFVAAGAVAGAALVLAGLALERDSSVVPPASAEVLRRAAAALARHPGTILHVAFTGTQHNPDGTTIRWRQESWQEEDPPHDSRLLNQLLRGTPAGVDQATTDGVPEIYDPASNTIYVGRAPTPHPSRSSQFAYHLTRGPRPGTFRLHVEAGRIRTRVIVITGAQARALRDGRDTIGGGFRLWRRRVLLIPALVPVRHRRAASQPDPDPFSGGFGAQIRALLRSGRARVVGPVVVHGRRAIQIATPDRSIVYDVEPHGYRPIELDTHGTGGGTSLDFRVYRFLPAGGNRDLLHLQAQHPGATVDRDPADFDRAQRRLFPHG